MTLEHAFSLLRLMLRHWLSPLLLNNLFDRRSFTHKVVPPFPARCKK